MILMFNVECLMFKDLENMRALRYLLIVALVSLTSVLSATNVAAQNLAQQPEMQMHSTSGMVYSGSTLPQAAAEGAYVTGTTIGTYSPADGSNNSGPHRAKKGWGGEGEPGDRPEPWETPLGDAALPLALCALAYLIYTFVRARVRE